MGVTVTNRLFVLGSEAAVSALPAARALSDAVPYELREVERRAGAAVYEFTTERTSIVPVVERLSREHPGVILTLEWVLEGGDEGAGRYRWQAGAQTAGEQFEATSLAWFDLDDRG